MLNVVMKNFRRVYSGVFVDVVYYFTSFYVGCVMEVSMMFVFVKKNRKNV